MQGISLADIMTAAGLTHGSFDRNFTSKKELATQASGVDSPMVDWRNGGNAVEEDINDYRVLFVSEQNLARAIAPGSIVIEPGSDSWNDFGERCREIRPVV